MASRSLALFRREARPGALSGAQARGAVVIEEREIGKLTVREGLPTPPR